MTQSKMVNSQITNWKTYQMYQREMITLAENVFEFENLPKFIDVAYLNKTLLEKGSIAFFKDEVLGVIALPYDINTAKLDVYGRPISIMTRGFNGQYFRKLNQGEFVIMYDNNGKYPLYLDICQMAERIAMCIRTEDVNIVQQRTPRIWKTSSDKELSVKRMINEIDSMQENVVTYDSLDIDDMSVISSPAPYVSDKIDIHLDKLWAEFYRLIGVANITEQKRERVIQDEMTASQGGTIASRYARFQPRQNAIEKINKLFNENISVHYYDGTPDSAKAYDAMEDVEREEDVVSIN